MNQRLDATLKHLTALVAADTRNPPRTITPAHDLFTYVQAQLPGFTHHVTDHGQGCVSLLSTRGKPRFLFNFHVDTVPADAAWASNPHSLQVLEDRAVGLGAADTKGAAACMLAAVNEVKGDVALLFTSDEEAGNSTCVREFLKGNIAYEGVVVAEPTRAEAVLAHRGICTFTVECSGTGGHASAARALEDSAVHELVRWAERAISAVRVWDHVEYRGLRGVRFNIGHIEGGTKPNMIASRATARCGFRAHAGLSTDDVLDAMRKLALHPDRFTLTPGFRAPPLPATARVPALALASRLGIPVGDPVDFWTEAALFSEAGLPVLVFGAGDIAQAHTAGEWVLLSQLQSVADRYVDILNRL